MKWKSPTLIIFGEKKSDYYLQYFPPCLTITLSLRISAMVLQRARSESRTDFCLPSSLELWHFWKCSSRDVEGEKCALHNRHHVSTAAPWLRVALDWPAWPGQSLNRTCGMLGCGIPGYGVFCFGAEDCIDVWRDVERCGWANQSRDRRGIYTHAQRFCPSEEKTISLLQGFSTPCCLLYE